MEEKGPASEDKSPRLTDNPRPAGRLEITIELEPPATARINPRLFAGNPHLISYKVRTGDSLASLAQACGCTWQQLARLNWGTEDLDEINWYLGTYFVCKTKKGDNYVFTDADDPGIILLPRLEDAVTGRWSRIVRATRFPVE
jgi:hypothetical protein